jgi:hypothetical protein
MESKALVVYKPTGDISFLVLCLPVWIAWVYCIYLARTQYEIDTKYRMTRITRLETMLKALEHKYTEQLDELKEQLYVQHEEQFTKHNEMTEQCKETFADLDRQCKLHEKYVYHVIDLQEKLKMLKKTFESPN